jgi:surface carbohydrate biosynthesis protein
MKTIVILVDNKRRDLPSAALIAHHLKKIGVRCELEPLGAWRSVLWAHKPDMIIFNHLNAEHLEKYSQELHRRGVLVSMLPNEGLIYDRENREFNVAKFHNTGHIDHFFCWNNAFADSAKAVWKNDSIKAHVIGIPRFDFYFPPLAEKFPSGPRKKVLICTNFAFAMFRETLPGAGERFFKKWSNTDTYYRDWKEIVDIDYENRERFFAFLNAAVQQTDHEIILRPHPNETVEIYENWHNSLDTTTKQKIRYIKEGSIDKLIFECDLQVARDTCTTSLESWIAGKPTIVIHLSNHPALYQDFTEKVTAVCTVPDDFPELINRILAQGEPDQFKKPREEHLREWCNTPDGRVCKNFAGLLKEIVEAHPSPDFSSITFSDVRRGLRLKLLRVLNLPCSYKPFTRVRYIFNRKKGKMRVKNVEKTIKPSDARVWEKTFKKLGV